MFTSHIFRFYTGLYDNEFIPVRVFLDVKTRDFYFDFDQLVAAFGCSADDADDILLEEKLTTTCIRDILVMKQTAAVTLAEICGIGSWFENQVNQFAATLYLRMDKNN